MIRLLTYLALPSRALHWGNVAPGRNLPLTRSWRPDPWCWLDVRALPDYSGPTRTVYVGGVPIVAVRCRYRVPA